MRICILLSFLWAGALSGQIVINDQTVNHSQADKIMILEDADHELTIDDILNNTHEFYEATHASEILDFNSSRWWIRFDVINNTNNNEFILETARPITNKVYLYEVQGDVVVQRWKNGDGQPFSKKAHAHRLNIFDLRIPPGDTVSYILELESDGEVITLPVRFWDKETFYNNDYESQLLHGFYYGLLALVAIIFFFFYQVLKDRSFLYYVIYVFFQMLLQFSLDGYSYQYFFPDNIYWANHIVLFSAGGAVIFITLYARSFLKTFKHHATFDRIFRIGVMLIALITLLSSFGGYVYEMSFPVINGMSLLITVLIIVAIFAIKRKGVYVDNWFTAAFIILIAGVVIFILGNFHVVGNASISQASLKISSALEVLALSVSMANKYRELQAEKEKAQEKALVSLKEKNELMDQMNVRLEQQVKERTAQINEQKEELAEKNQDIVASIKYAQRIQDAVLPPPEQIKDILPDSFVFYKPRDIVSGDFYFIEKVSTTDKRQLDLALFAAVDCTGHGVPGAFVSMLGNNYLKLSLSQNDVNSPAEALDFLNVGINSSLRQETNQTGVRDGMDMALCALNRENRKLYFSGAKNQVYIIRDNDGSIEPIEGKRNPLVSEDGKKILLEIKGDRHPIGAPTGDKLEPFTNHEFDLNPGDCLYVFSDGYADQFGGEKGKKYTYKKFKRLLMSIADQPMEKQKEILEKDFTAWCREHEQLDDVCVIGVRV